MITNKEKMKSALLITMILMSVALIFLKFDFVQLFNLYQSSPYTYSLSLEEALQSTIRPKEVIIRFGGNNNTKIITASQRYYNQTRSTLKQALADALSIEEVNEEAYLKSQSSKSLELGFTALHGKLLSRSFFLESSFIDEITDIKSILVPLIDESAIYIKSSGKIYRIQTAAQLSLQTVDSLENSKYVKYYSLNYLFGSTSQELVPSDSPDINVQTYDTISSLEAQSAEEIGKAVLKERYDFANRVVETDGSNIYTYNYGQEVLKISPNGYIRYLNEEFSSKDSNVEQASLAAMDFMQKLGIDLKTVAYEKSIPVKIQGRDAYRLIFSHTADDLRIMPANENYELSAVVVGDKIYSFTGIKRTMLPYDLSRNKNIITPFEALETEYSSLSEVHSVQSGVELFDKIGDIELLYFMDSNYAYIPCWKIIIAEKAYIFNGYTGEIMSYGLG